MQEIDSILMRIAPHNFPGAVEAICNMCRNNEIREDMDIDGSAAHETTELIPYAAEFLRQSTFCKQQLLFGVTVVLGVLMQTRKDVAQHLCYRTKSFCKLISHWTKSATLHSLSSTALSLSGDSLTLSTKLYDCTGQDTRKTIVASIQRIPPHCWISLCV